MIVSLIIVILFYSIKCQACSLGFFGPRCQFKCHCSDQCDDYGNCYGSSRGCSSGWFGLGCQYQDLAVTAVASPQSQSVSIPPDTICIYGRYLKSVTLTWQISFQFTWMRMTLLDSASLKNFTITFQNITGHSTVCRNQRLSRAGQHDFDIHCDLNTLVTNLTVEGDVVASLCDIHVSAGRNVALLQRNVFQSTTQGQYLASYAVDGIVAESCAFSGCSHTNTTDSSPYWKIVFDQPYQINRFVIYNRKDAVQYRLVQFSLQAKDANQTVIFTYTDPNVWYLLVYTVLYPGGIPIAEVTILQTNKDLHDSVPFVSINEFEAYGDCVSGYWGLNCSRQCPVSCPASCSKEDGSCNNVCFGYVDPPKCLEKCSPDKWGLNCSTDCRLACYNTTCDHLNGTCVQGCLGYSDPPACTQICDDHFFGLNCNENCSVQCLNQKCSSTSGRCFLCIPGYQGDFCNEHCSDRCLNQMCNSTTGKCYSCIPGYRGDYCNETCQPTYFGTNCSQRCNTSCVDQMCDPRHGYCISCSKGRHGSQCDVCPDHYFGINCSERCSEKCTSKMCNSTSGICGSCMPGYQGEFCEQNCDPKYFGQNCSQQCNGSCADQLCHPLDGSCIKCPIGKYGTQCDDCPVGTYGEDCKRQCSDHCLNQTCDIVNGTCQFGCNSGFIGPQCLVFSASQQVNENKDEAEVFVGVIVGSVFGALVLTTLLIITIIIIRRQKGHKLIYKQCIQRQNVGTRPSLIRVSSFHSIHRDEASVIQNSLENQMSQSAETYVNTAPHFKGKTSIDLDNLYSFIKIHSEEYFTRQFESLPQTPDVTTDAGSHNENKIKNRFKNICPYDHSRVHLKANSKLSEKDYINASYIKGFDDNLKFIASQGPKETTINDFVRMLWEQNTEIIVMLTNLIEDGKVKCEKYWPETDEKIFGEIAVRLTAVQTFADYTIRKLELVKKDQPTHQITQFHFTSWPDKSVPTAAWSLVDFEQRVFTSSTSEPIVVHCSAGVGRTGTFIALHNVMKESEKTGYVDFFNTVIKLRQDRMQMVQTAEQYEFLHRAALAAYVCIGTTSSVNNVSDRLKRLDEKMFSSQSKIDFEFKRIRNACDTNRCKAKESHVNENEKNVYENSGNDATSFKNRFSEIIPCDTYRPHLTCYNSEVGDYINAVILPSYKHRDHYFLTQLPMPSTVTDFWRLVTQYNINILVAFELDSMVTDETYGKYLPPNNEQELLCSPFEIRSLYMKEEELWEEQKLNVCLDKTKSFPSVKPMEKDSHDVVHFKCKFIEFDAYKILNFIKAVRAQNLSDGRIIYMCRNGALYSGLACALSLLLDRMECDSSVTVPLVVGSVKSVKPEAVPNCEQYRLLYQILELYSQTLSEYGNSLQQHFHAKFGNNVEQFSLTEYGNIKSKNEYSQEAKIYANV